MYTFWSQIFFYFFLFHLIGSFYYIRLFRPFYYFYFVLPLPFVFGNQVHVNIFGLLSADYASFALILLLLIVGENECLKRNC